MTSAGRLEALRQRRRWLLAETPASRTQARLGQAYVGWLGFRGNPLAMAGLAVLVALVLIALLTPLLTSQSPVAQDLGQRLQPRAPGTGSGRTSSGGTSTRGCSTGRASRW